MEGAGGGEVGVSVIPVAQVLTGFLLFSGEVRKQRKSLQEKSLLITCFLFIRFFIYLIKLY